MKQYPVRYGRNSHVVLAIVLPCLSIVPFILLMQLFKPMEDWLAYLIIFIFLGCLVVSVLGLVKIIYPPALLSVEEKQLSIRFTATCFLRPAGFTLHAADITSFTPGDLNGDDYMRFETKVGPRKFQLSARSSGETDYGSFKEAMRTVSEMIHADTVNPG